MTTVPSFDVHENPSVAASCTWPSHASFWCVRRRKAPFSSAYTSPMSVVVLIMTASEPPALGEISDTTRGPLVTLSVAPVAASIRAT